MRHPISLVTGGAGFIGSHVVDHLLAMGHTVIVFDDLSGGTKRNVAKQAVFIKGSITNSKLLEKLFTTYTFDYVYHLAAFAAEGLSHFIRRFTYENNVIGSVNLINLAIKHKVKHFVFTSSIAVYGNNKPPMRETMTPSPVDPYGIAKYSIELDLQAAERLFGLSFTIFRPHNVYGERQNYADPYRNVIGIFINSLLANKPMPIFGDGKQKRAFSYIGDVAPHIAQSINIPQAKNQIINIGEDTPSSVLELSKIVASAFGVRPQRIFLPHRDEVVYAYSDHLKAKRIFRIKKTIAIYDGIANMAAWAKKRGPQKPKKLYTVEVADKLPEFWGKLT